MRWASLGLLIVTSCGSSPHSPPDGPGGTDSAIADARADSAPERGTVYVHALDLTYRTEPLPDTPILFADPQGTVETMTMTDMFGNAHADVLPGSSVIEIAGPSSLFWIRSIAPGDHITIGFPEDDATVQAGTFTVTYTAHVNATSYVIYAPCFGGGTSTTTSKTWTVTVGCRSSAMDILVLAKNASGAIIGYVDKPNVPFFDGGTTAMPAGWTTTNGQFTTSLTNIGAEITMFWADRRAPAGYGFESGGSIMTPTGTSMLVNFVGPITGTARFGTSLYKSGAQQYIRDVRSGTATGYDLDVEASLLPWIGSATLDVATAKVTIPATAGQPPDVVETILSYLRGATQYAWWVLGPDVGDLTLPQLPAPYAAMNPQAGDTAQAVSVTATDADSVDGWAFARLDPFRIAQDEYDTTGEGTHWITSTPP